MINNEIFEQGMEQLKHDVYVKPHEMFIVVINQGKIAYIPAGGIVSGGGRFMSKIKMNAQEKTEFFGQTVQMLLDPDGQKEKIKDENK